jgi:hypothetical protein
MPVEESREQTPDEMVKVLKILALAMGSKIEEKHG